MTCLKKIQTKRYYNYKIITWNKIMEGNYKKWINKINSKQDVLTEDNV